MTDRSIEKNLIGNYNSLEQWAPFINGLDPCRFCEILHVNHQ